METPAGIHPRRGQTVKKPPQELAAGAAKKLYHVFSGVYVENILAESDLSNSKKRQGRFFDTQNRGGEYSPPRRFPMRFPRFSQIR